jgi:hypothetical protein
MKEVDPQKLIPGQTYYLGYKLTPGQTVDRDNYSYMVTGTFDRYDDTTYDISTDNTPELFEKYKTALFKDVESDKPPARSLGVNVDNRLLQFGVGPDGCAYTIYPVRNPIGESFGGKKTRKSRKSRKSRKTKSRRRR